MIALILQCSIHLSVICNVGLCIVAKRCVFLCMYMLRYRLVLCSLHITAFLRTVMTLPISNCVCFWFREHYHYFALLLLLLYYVSSTVSCWNKDYQKLYEEANRKWTIYVNRIVTWPMTSRDPERLRSWPQYANVCRAQYLENCFLPARRYASAGYSDRNVSVCPSVRLSVRHAPVLCQNEES